jgi:mono/diheme cytochrome c family protein
MRHYAVLPKRRLAAATLFAVAVPCSAGDSTPEARMALGKEVFTRLAQPPCSVCHALQEAGASAEIGPNLDQLKPDAQRVAAAVRKGIGIMPAFGTSLTEEQIQAVAHYVARASGAEK